MFILIWVWLYSCKLIYHSKCLGFAWRGAIWGKRVLAWCLLRLLNSFKNQSLAAPESSRQGIIGESMIFEEPLCQHVRKPKTETHAWKAVLSSMMLSTVTGSGSSSHMFFASLVVCTLCHCWIDGWSSQDWSQCLNRCFGQTGRTDTVSQIAHQIPD